MIKPGTGHRQLDRLHMVPHTRGDETPPTSCISVLDLLLRNKLPIRDKKTFGFEGHGPPLRLGGTAPEDEFAFRRLSAIGT